MKNLPTKIALVFCYIIFISPRWMKRLAAVGIAVLWFDVLRIRRRVVLENIRKCFPEWDEKRVVWTGRQSLINTGTTITDFAELAFLKKENMGDYITIEGEENLKEALKGGKGVFLLTAHIANGDFGIAALPVHGYPLYVITKRFTSQWLDKIWFGIRGRFGTQFINARNSSFDILKALKKNGIVVFVLDQFMGPPLGVRTTFFGMPTGTAMGLALFAEKTGAPVLLSYVRRESGGKYVLVFGESVVFEDQGDKKANLQFMTQKYTNQIEEIVRRYPEQWMWLHRRWKPFNE